MSNQRSFLFLQGMATQFFAKLGAALAKNGHDVHRINFNGGDKLFWLRAGSVDFRGDLKSWPQFLEARLAEWGVTDIILFGDCRPLHKEAVRVASHLRGGGIGGQMIDWAVERCRARDCRMVQLFSQNDRPGAHRFYERLGWKRSHQGFKRTLG